MKLPGSKLIRPKSLVLIFIAVGLIVIGSAAIEFHQSKQEVYSLLEEEAESILETLIIGSENALLTSEEVENQMEARLLNNAGLIKILLEGNRLSNSLLNKIAEQNGLSRINVFSPDAELIYSSVPDEIGRFPYKNRAAEMLAPIFNNDKDTLLLGIREMPGSEGKRFITALAAAGNYAVVLNLDAMGLLEFRGRTGFGNLIRSAAMNDQIEYIALQNEYGIIAASGRIDSLDALSSSGFLMESLDSETFSFRFFEYGGHEVYEAVHPFYYKYGLAGVFRIGFSMEPIENINSRILRRVIVMGLIFFVLGSVMLLFVFTRQNFSLLQKQFRTMEAYSNRILDNVSDAILVTDNKGFIKIVNNAAVKLFGLEGEKPEGKSLTALTGNDKCEEILRSESDMMDLKCTIGGRRKDLLISRAPFKSENDEENLVLVVKDYTELKLLEEQIQRKERLAAMGELASGVAHEIRNPLNSIGTIVQQLDKDYEAVENSGEFHRLTKLVYSEVKRINETVKSFLKFARPEPMESSEFDLNVFIDDVIKQYKPVAGENNIELSSNSDIEDSVIWDRNQIRQVLINLIQNAIDAIGSDGKINVTAQQKGTDVEVTVSDTGEGIPEDVLPKIFNIYFTTKAKGTGIGLSMVQRIVFEHGGVISVESEKNSGTKFIIRLPLEAVSQKEKNRI